MTREEAAAEFATRRAAASYAIRDTLVTRNAWDMADAALAAADAHDAAHGIHRVSLDEETIKHAVEAICEAAVVEGDLGEYDATAIWAEPHVIARAVLAAAVEADR